MTFYEALQLDPAVLKSKARQAGSPAQKRWFIKALIVRDVLLVAFSIVFVSALTAVFGSENSPMAVVIFCALLSIRFVDFGYRVSHSLAALALVFAILLVSPVLMQMVPPLLGLAVNFFSILAVLVMTCERPEMGNGGLYMFGYIFLTGSLPSPDVFAGRAGLAAAGFLICGLVLYKNHRHKHSERTLLHVLGGFSLHSPRVQWQLQLALALSLLFFAGRFFSLNRFMWIGFACSSLLSAYPSRIHERLLGRAGGAIAGSLLFGLAVFLVPPQFTFLFGPVSGLCLGLCSTYHGKTMFNCLGALLMAASVYGVPDAMMLRICNNLIGLAFGYAFFHLFQRLFVDLCLPRLAKQQDCAG